MAKTSAIKVNMKNWKQSKVGYSTYHSDKNICHNYDKKQFKLFNIYH